MTEGEQVAGALPLDKGLSPANTSDQSAERLASSQQQQSTGRRRKRWLKRALGLIVVAVILTLLGRNLASSWNTLSTYHWQASAPLLALAFVGFVAQTLSYP